MKASLKSGAFFIYFCKVKWIGKRISFVDQKDKTTIVIDPSKNAWISAIMGAWLGMWYAIGGTVIWALNVMNLKNQEQLILWIFLVFWLYYAWRVTMSFLWNLRGQEYIKIDQEAFYLKKSLRHIGKTNQYFFENIKNTLRRACIKILKLNIYFGFFLLMPWWSRIGQTKPVPDRVTFTPH